VWRVKPAALAGAVAAVVAFAAAYVTGTAYNVAFVLPVAAVVGAGVRVVAARGDGSVAGGMAGRIGSIVFWALLATTTVLAVPRAQVTGAAFRLAIGTHVGAVVVLLGFAALRRRAPSGPRQVVTAAGSAFLAVQLARSLLGVGVPSAVLLDAPFDGTWAVMQGGPSVLLNHHYAVRSQRYALDVVRLVDGSRLDGPSGELASYHCFGSTIRSPAAGLVVRVVASRPDQPIGATDRSAPAGNHVVIRLAPDRYVLLAHLQSGSVSVAVGSAVVAGQPIGRCGNSGNSSEPHLHVQVQTDDAIDSPGMTTVPVRFGTGGTRLRRNSVIEGVR
jgi:hypothetical protein